MQYPHLLPTIVVSLLTSVIVFMAGYVYEGYRVRAVVAVQLEALTARVAALEQRLLALEHPKK
jgi:cell division protein FtsB